MPPPWRKRLCIGAVILLAALIEPALHGWLLWDAPEDAVHTGLHVGDTTMFLHSMAAGANGFDSPYATCKAEQGPRSWRYYAIPHLLLYVLVGPLGRLLSLPPFVYLGLLNGLGAALYLLAIYALFVEVSRKYAERAFYLFLFTGGLGGILYAATGLLGLHTHPDFTESFQRFALYELTEGQHLAPTLLATRFYYTLPLACMLYALALFLRAVQQARPGLLAGVVPLMFTGAFFNFRLGVFIWVAACLFLLTRSDWSWRARAVFSIALGTPTFAAAALAWFVFSLSYTFTSNLMQVASMAMWLIPFLTATCFHWLVLPSSLFRGLRGLPGPLWYGAFALVGYLAAFAGLVALYQAYYGNWLHGGDTAATVAVSDWAMLGAIPGLAAAHCLRGKREAAGDTTQGWLALWFLLFLAGAVSAFGQGWYLRLGPQRLMILMAPPLALLTAMGLGQSRPALRRLGYAVLVGFGVISMAVGALFFQGPLGRQAGEGPFAYLHYGLMSEADAELIEALPPGYTAVPAWNPIAFGEVLSMRPGVRVIGGPGAMNLSDQSFATLQRQVDRFFDPATDDAERQAFAREWCLDHVYCPDLCPLEEGVLAQFRAAFWLDEAVAAGRGCVFSVHRDGRD